MAKSSASGHRRAITRACVCWTIYVVGCFFWSWVFNSFALAYPLKIAIAIAAVAPAALSVIPLMELWREQDELQMRLGAEGIVFSFALTAILTWTYGFLELYAGFPHLIMWFVWPVMATFWIVGRALAGRRYR